MSVLGNSVYWGKYRHEIPREIARYLPPDWTLDLQDLPGDAVSDAIVRITAPDGSRAEVALEFKASLPPSVAGPALLQLARSPLRDHLLVAPYISPQTQRYLRERGAFYLDLSGNAHWTLRSPAVHVSSTSQKPRSEKRTTGRTLRGAKAGRLIRELCEARAPFTVSSLARELSIDYGNVSRYLDLLGRDALVVRNPRGPVTSVHWEGVLRRWSEDYRRPRAEPYFDPRGLEHFHRSVASSGMAYALTGVVAAAAYAPYTVVKTTSCYCDDLDDLARRLGLMPGDQHANVMLLRPFDSVVYSRTKEAGSNIIVSPAQAAIDLLAGRGRELDQAEELIRWMKANEDLWRG